MEPTAAELYRTVQQMMEDSKEHRLEMREVVKGLVADVKEVKQSLGEVVTQTTKTNGGVSMLKSDFYGGDGKEGTLSTVTSLKSRERYVAGALAVVFALFGIVPFFLNLYIKDSVATAIKEIAKTDPHIIDSQKASTIESTIINK